MVGTRVLLAGKHQIFREGLAALLEREPSTDCVDTCGSELEIIEKVNKNHLDVLILDIESSECIETIRRIRESLTQLDILVLTHSESTADFVAALEAGAKAYVAEDVGLEDLVRIIHLVAHGELVASSRVASGLVEKLNLLEEQNNTATLAEINLLSKREGEILALVEQGLTDREIAVKLFISEHTVSVHMRNIRRKLQAHNRQHAVALARAKGYIN